MTSPNSNLAQRPEAQLPPTETSRPWRNVLLMAVAVLLVLPPVVQSIANRREHGWSMPEDWRWPTQTVVRGFEAELEQRFWLARWGRRHYSLWVDRWLRRGNAQVLFGVDGWLLHRDSVRALAAPPLGTRRAQRLLERPMAAATAPRDAILDFHHRLHERGIQLLVVPVPAKVSVLPEAARVTAPEAARVTAPEAARATAPEAAVPGVAASTSPINPGVARLLQELQQAGIEVVDPTVALALLQRQGTPAYLRLDTHWSWAGMRRSVAAVALRLEQTGLLDGLGRAPFDRRRVTFETDPDLVGLLPYGREGGLFEPGKIEIEQVASTQSDQDPTPRSGASVLVLGDSFTGVYRDPRLGHGRRGGFAEWLAAELQTPVEVIALPGGGPTRVRRALALQPQALAGKRVVVWQFSQRDLLLGREAWEIVELPAGTAVAGDQGSEERSVRARLIATTEMPETFDYPDCLVILDYELLDGELPDAAAGRFLAVTWGWRDWQRQEVARERVGDVRRLRLAPLAGRAQLEQTCWMSDIELRQTPWWLVESEVSR